MNVCCLFHALASLILWQHLPVLIQWEDGWAPEPVWAFWRRSKSVDSAWCRTLHQPSSSLFLISSMISVHKIETLRYSVGNGTCDQLMGCVWGAGSGPKIFIFTRPSRLDLGIALCRGLCIYGENASSHENYNPPPSRDEVKSVCCCISTLQDCVFKHLIAGIFVPLFLEIIESFEEFL